MGSPETLHVRDLAFAFGNGDQLFTGINLDVGKGETVVLFGGNGSGKSTLLRCIAGLLPYTDGEISIDESSATDLRSRIGLVMQNPELQMLAPTVEEEIALGLEFQGWERKQMKERVQEVMARYSLQDLRYRAPETLSGGQMQRVALAAIVAMQPAFLLLDEPDSLLDAPSRREFLQAVSKLGTEHGLLWACADAARLPQADRCYRLTNVGALLVTREQIIQGEGGVD